jgi:hypothetical protein
MIATSFGAAVNTIRILRRGIPYGVTGQKVHNVDFRTLSHADKR